ncbi:MAG: hypothetical protein FJX57_16790 [Alphaproteobacteria bacterium]|nr:hypothetical protein [Alphaproteobacteria bacterium]
MLARRRTRRVTLAASCPKGCRQARPRRLSPHLVASRRALVGTDLSVTQLTAARPDGHTLGFIWNSPLTTSPHTLQVAYTPDNYVPILSIGYSSYVPCVKPDLPATDARPGRSSPRGGGDRQLRRRRALDHRPRARRTGARRGDADRRAGVGVHADGARARRRHVGVVGAVAEDGGDDPARAGYCRSCW